MAPISLKKRIMSQEKLINKGEMEMLMKVAVRNQQKTNLE